MIKFKECSISGYPARTLENARADATIAIATDFSTPGERLTKRWANHYGLYVPIDFGKLRSVESVEKAMALIGHWSKVPKTLNIAGNGIYSLPVDQGTVDTAVHRFLFELFKQWKPATVCSGGQTGVDEAGLKAADKLGIPAFCLAPKGWMFRGKNGRDISDEKLFKERFKS